MDAYKYFELATCSTLFMLIHRSVLLVVYENAVVAQWQSNRLVSGRSRSQNSPTAPSTVREGIMYKIPPVEEGYRRLGFFNYHKETITLDGRVDKSNFVIKGYRRGVHNVIVDFDNYRKARNAFEDTVEYIMLNATYVDMIECLREQ